MHRSASEAAWNDDVSSETVLGCWAGVLRGIPKNLCYADLASLFFQGGACQKCILYANVMQCAPACLYHLERPAYCRCRIYGYGNGQSLRMRDELPSVSCMCACLQADIDNRLHNATYKCPYTYAQACSDTGIVGPFVWIDMCRHRRTDKRQTCLHNLTQTYLDIRHTHLYICIELYR